MVGSASAADERRSGWYPRQGVVDGQYVVQLFRTLKQSLRVKTFVGTSANAVSVQIWTALIAVLLLKYLQMRRRFDWSLSNLVALLRQQLFVYRDLKAWLNEPFQAPAERILTEQLELSLV